jgi:predicted DNA-binding transcriptional regulator YafY
MHRYFRMLENLGMPLYSERGRYGGFSLVPGYSLPPLMFSAEEAAVLYLGAGLVRQMWGDIYREDAESAIVKLENVIPAELKDEMSSLQNSFGAFDMHRADMSKILPVLRSIKNQVSRQKQTFIEYLSSREGQTERRVDFYGLFYRWGWWYALGYCHLREEIRWFRLDRIQSYKLLDEEFSKPADFNLERFLYDKENEDEQIN